MALEKTAKKPRTVPKSFRIDRASLSAIEQEATRQSVSPNTLVNQILKQFAEHQRYARKLNTVELSSSIFRGILAVSDTDKLIDLAKIGGSSIPQAFAMAKNGKVDLNSLLEHVRSLAIYAHLYEVNEKIGDREHVVTLMHDFGLGWSIFLVHYITAMFQHVGLSPKLEMSDRTVIFTLAGP